ncbi:unnamed protein product [Menidia menidia]|uniref:(Atlantic silverside) hypothetical protein n=1 Tax=Menidia menidia TaxID=238744 RepID=A0A8S4BR83_9TELE|nr:unnamed protein product [Menidia menidia]
MDVAISLLVLSSLSQLVAPQAATQIPFRPTVEVISGDVRIFSRETLRLGCSVPVSYKSGWTFWWFRGSEKLPQTGQNLTLWNVNLNESGKYSCQGLRDSLLGTRKTLKSLPVEIDVDGGWAMLQAPAHSVLVGETLKLTCHLRMRLPLHETILYKDGIEVVRQNGHSQDFYLTNATLLDEGMYSCRPSWDMRGRTHSVISVSTPVHVLEVLTRPLLEIENQSNFQRERRMKLICHVQYNTHGPAPPLYYYFYKANNRLGSASSNNYMWVRQAPGQYSCRATVPVLDLSRWSETRDFGSPQP